MENKVSQIKTALADYDMLSIMGATAGGKTSFAVFWAAQISGEIISADSRQVYRGMDIGTGKDIADYTLNGKKIPCHLIDILPAGEKYNVYEYQKDFFKVYEDIKKRQKFPVLCGGSGMYIEAVLKGYKLIQVPVNEELRMELQAKTKEELVAIVSKQKHLHNTTDTGNRKRLIRAAEIACYYQKHPKINCDYPQIKSLNLQIIYDREVRRRRIEQRLRQRFQEGMIEEVQALLNKGIDPETLKYYGLEYKFITSYLQGELSYDEMYQRLYIAICQFSKRQMTWFRKMEKQGFSICKIDGESTSEKQAEQILRFLEQKSK